MSVPRREWFDDVPRKTRSFVLLGFASIAVSVIGFGHWATSAMIAGAIVVGGAFVATGDNKVVQHFEGGVIQRIAVHEGDVVEAGQTLIVLDDTRPAAELRRLILKRASAGALAARLRAEAKDEAKLVFPPDLLAHADDPVVADILRNQQLTFAASRQALMGEIATLREGVKSLERRIEGGETQIHHTREQLALLDQEIAAKSALVDRGLVTRPHVLALQRAAANLRGEIGRLTGEIGDARERISRAHEQIAALRSAAVSAAVEKLQAVDAEHRDVIEQIRAAQAVLERITITAPVRGVVVKLNYKTPGGVIQAGKSILEIVPVENELVIEVRVRPQDIDSVRRGAEAEVRLTALNRRTTPMIPGSVVYVSADSLGDQPGQRGASDAYVVRVALNGEALSRLAAGFKPTPGMPAEVYIRTTERTFLEYLMRPIKDSMERAFRET